MNYRQAAVSVKDLYGFLCNNCVDMEHIPVEPIFCNEDLNFAKGAKCKNLSHQNLVLTKYSAFIVDPY